MNQNPDNLSSAGQRPGVNQIDYRETTDLTEVHAAVHREHSVGTPGSVPMPVWLMVLCGVAIFWAGTSFSGGFGGDYFSVDNYSVHPGVTTPKKGTGAGTEAAELSPVEQGAQYFAQNCAACHQPTGLGVPGSYPPLAKSEYVNGGTRRLGMILLKGLQGPLKVEGATYNGSMPPWGASLTDKKIAAILTYVRQAFGNSSSPVTPEQITDARKEFANHPASWSEADLQAVPATDELPGGGAPAAPAAAAPAAPAK